MSGIASGMGPGVERGWEFGEQRGGLRVASDV